MDEKAKAELGLAIRVMTHMQPEDGFISSSAADYSWHLLYDTGKLMAHVKYLNPTCVTISSTYEATEAGVKACLEVLCPGDLGYSCLDLSSLIEINEETVICTGSC